MDKVSDLNYIIHLYIDNAKISRVSCNFLMESSIKYILDNISSDTTQFYTSFEIEYQGRIIHRSTLPLSNDNIVLGP